MGSHSFLVCKVSAEKSALSVMGFPLLVTRSFSLADIRFLFFILTLDTLMTTCCGKVNFAMYFPGDLGLLVSGCLNLLLD